MRSTKALLIASAFAFSSMATSALALDVGGTVSGVGKTVGGVTSGVLGGSNKSSSASGITGALDGTGIDHTITGAAGSSQSLGGKPGSMMGSYTHPNEPKKDKGGYTKITKIGPNIFKVLSDNDVKVLNFKDFDIFSNNKILNNNEVNILSNNFNGSFNGNFSHNKFTFIDKSTHQKYVFVFKDKHHSWKPMPHHDWKHEHHPKPGHYPKPGDELTDGMQTASAFEAHSAPQDCNAWKASIGTRHVDIGEYERHCPQIDN
jgi:hypothetical protein